MSRLYQKVEQIWWSNDQPPFLLRAASRIYDVVNRHNLSRRKSRAISTTIPMISVGNITAGGSGKTPFVIWLATRLKSEGFRPVILCRGDGGKGGMPELLSDNSTPQKVGDEAVLLYQKSDCPVISGHDRIQATTMAEACGDIMILDDGFQYLQLKRVCDIVLIPAEGIGNGQLIPAGPLRESVDALNRADLIVRTGQSDKIKPLSSNKEWQWWCCEAQLEQVAGPSSEKPGMAVALTAIARPGRFIQSLEKTGMDVVESFTFPDHHPFSTHDIQQVLQHNEAVVVTAKDAVKLQPIWPVDRPLWVLQQQAEAEPGLFEAIKGFVR